MFYDMIWYYTSRHMLVSGGTRVCISVWSDRESSKLKLDKWIQTQEPSLRRHLEGKIHNYLEPRLSLDDLEL